MILGRKSLIIQAEKLRHQADLLLRKSKLIDLLGRYGEVDVTGSYRLNLMTKGDIDIHVVNPAASKSAARDLLDRLIDQNFFDSYQFYDGVTHFRKNMAHGYYIGLKTVFLRRKWKIDIWFLKRPDLQGARVTKLVERSMDKKTRLAILNLKQKRDEQHLDIPSALIYEAVLTKHVRTFPVLLRFAHQKR